MSYLEVSVDILGYDIFRDRFVLTVHNVHVKLPLVTFEERTELLGAFQAALEGFEKKAESEKNKNTYL